MAVRPARPAIFFDKDGTLVEDVPYNVRPDCIRLTPGAGEAMRRLYRAGFTLCVVSNQSGVGRGYFPESALEPVKKRLQCLARGAGAKLEGFYYCPHWPDATDPPEQCACRKPAEGLLLQAAEELSLDRTRSWMIGDILDDIEAGHRAGARCILIDNGNETEWQMTPIRTPDFFARDLAEAANLILAEDGMLAAGR